MKTTTVSEMRIVGAPAREVYALLSDYRGGHPRVLPEGYFESLDVESGGVGAGTVFRVRMRALGQTREMRMAVTEPVPGRVLAETDVDTGLVTRFTVEPAGPGHSKVTIATEWRPKPGVLGELERRVSSAVMSRIYVRELAKLDAVVARDRAA